MIESLFIKATQKKYRFPSPQGSLSVEQLWDLPLTSTRPNTANLNSIANQLNQAIEGSKEIDFVNGSRSRDTENGEKLEIVLYVISQKKEENAKKEAQELNKKKKGRLLELLAQKQDEALLSKTEEEIKSLIEALGQ